MSDDVHEDCRRIARDADTRLDARDRLIAELTESIVRVADERDKARADRTVLVEAMRREFADRMVAASEAAKVAGRALVEERDKALADRSVLVEALRRVVAWDMSCQRRDEAGRVSVLSVPLRLDDVLRRCADALRTIGEEP